MTVENINGADEYAATVPSTITTEEIQRRVLGNSETEVREAPTAQIESAAGSATKVAADGLTDKKREGQPVDFYQPRRIVLTNNIKNKEFEFVHQTVALNDEVWLEFQNALNPRHVSENEELVYKVDTRLAVNETYEKLVPDIPTGYEQFFEETLTLKNYGKLIPYLDRQAVIDKTFAFAILEDEEGDFFFDGDGLNIFEIDIPLGGGLLKTGRILLRKKTKRHENDFKTATTPQKSKVKRQRHVEVSAKGDFDKLSALFTELAAGAENFEDGKVPIWIQVGLMNYYFNEFAVPDTK